MREIRLSGSEGGGTEVNRFSSPRRPPEWGSWAIKLVSGYGFN